MENLTCNPVTARKSHLRSHFNNDISIIIQTHWHFHFDLLTPCQVITTKFAYVMTAVLSCHVQTFVVIPWPGLKSQENIFSLYLIYELKTNHQ